MNPGIKVNLYPDTKPQDLAECGSVIEAQLVRDAIGDRLMPAAVLLVEIDGKVHRVATSLRLLRMANLALCSRMAAERGETWYFEPGELDGTRS